MNQIFYSIINTHPGQLFYRLKYLLRRNLRTRMSHHYKKKLDRSAEYSVNEKFRLECLIKKSNLIKRRGDDYKINFLNESKTFRIPFDWHSEELNKGTRLWKLNLHYMEYLTECENTDFQIIILDWINSNPPYMKNYALDNWNSYALSIRTVIWMYEYSKRKENLEEEFAKRMLDSLYQQIIFLNENPELDIGGNHIIKNIKALLWAGSFFKSVQSDKWTKKGEALLEKELSLQILNDGMHYELSPSYHCQVFIDLLECYIALQNSVLKKKLYSVLSKMIQVLIDLTMADGFISQFSDSGFHMAPSPSECLYAWKHITQTSVNQNKVVMLRDSGYYGIHDSDMDFIVDCGKIGADNLPAHGHGDIFSFELCVNKKRMIIDTGVYEYNPGEKRSYSRSTRAHNTVTLDDKDQGEFYSSFRLGRRAKVQVDSFIESDHGFELSAVHNGYRTLKNNPVHQRNFRVSGNNIRISDFITGGASQSVKARLLIHPDCRISMLDSDIYIENGSSLIKIHTDHDYSVIQTSWFPDFGAEVTCYQIIINYGLAPCKGAFAILISETTNKEFSRINSLQTNLS